MSRRFLGLCCALAFLSGCATTVPKFQPSMNNVSSLQNEHLGQVRVGEFTAADAKVNQLTIRGGALNSPYGGSYAAYFRQALRQELSLAGLLRDDAKVEVSGVLLRNELDASGFSKAHADIEARLKVSQGGGVRYDKSKSIHHEWESSFAAAIAVPKAHQNYSIAVQKLLRSFYDDADFQKALQ